MSEPEMLIHPVIDMAGIVLDGDGWEEYLLGFARRAPDYLNVFERRFAALAGVSPAECRLAAERGPETLARLLTSGGRLGIDIDKHVSELAAQGVCHQVMLGPACSTPRTNDRLATMAARHPARLQAWAGLDLRQPGAATRELHRCVGELGMTGGSLVHFTDDVQPLSAGCHEVYAAAARLGVPLWMHVGHNLSRSQPVDLCSWRHIDEIARAHPDLVIVCGHAGWPWMLEMVALCQRHPNVYLEFSTYRASHMSVAGSGWEPLLAYGQTTIRDKVLFGSVEYAHGLTVRQLADEVAALDVPAHVAGRWLHDNAVAVLGLDDHVCQLDAAGVTREVVAS